LDILEKRKISFLCWDLNSKLSSPWPSAILTLLSWPLISVCEVNIYKEFF
jgi:hypothetical protein